MKIHRVIFFAGLLSVSATALGGSKWTGLTTVTGILSNANGSLYITVAKQALPYVPSCTGKSSLYLNGTQSGAKGMHADLLAAKISELNVNIAVDDTKCQSGYRIITGAKVL